MVLAVGLLALWKASQHVPKFYGEALAVDRAVLEEASDQLVQNAAALASDVNQQGPWQAVFTEGQINGWLAVDLVKNHPELLPRSVREPRIRIEPDGLTAVCRFKQGRSDIVLSVTVDAYVAEPNVVALRVRKARAGALPLPLEDVLKEISEAAARSSLKIQWRQTQGDPVALVSLPPPGDPADRRLLLETLRLGQGTIYLSGSTE